MKTIMILILILLAPLKALADTSLIVGGFSHHTSDGYKKDGKLIPWNEKNPLVAIEQDGYFVGKMTNSYNEDTTFAGYHHTARVLGLMLMVSNKYERSRLPILGSLSIGGFLTVDVGPLLLLTIPGKVYVVTVQIKL